MRKNLFQASLLAYRWPSFRYVFCFCFCFLNIIFFYACVCIQNSPFYKYTSHNVFIFNFIISLKTISPNIFILTELLRIRTFTHEFWVWGHNSTHNRNGRFLGKIDCTEIIWNLIYNATFISFFFLLMIMNLILILGNKDWNRRKQIVQGLSQYSHQKTLLSDTLGTYLTLLIGHPNNF